MYCFDLHDSFLSGQNRQTAKNNMGSKTMIGTDERRGKSVSTDCPYAIALLNHENNQHHGELDGSSVESMEDGPMDDLLTATRQNCPAFAAAKGCPFKNASSPNHVKETLLQIPSSHYEMASFLQVLQGLHKTSDALGGSNASQEYQLPGGCPVPASIKSNVPGGFREVLENMSLAGIMGQLAQEFEREQLGLEDHSGSEMQESIEGPTDVVSKEHASSRISEDNAVDSLKGVASPRLSQSLKIGTAAAHEAAENVHFVKNFIRGQIDRRLYGQMILSLYFVYKSLEELLDLHGPDEFTQCHFPTELGRLKALSDDVEFWYGPRDRRVLKPSPATADYIHRIQDIARKEPLLLLAHSYTRYLGDLSGGKILARVARRALHLDRSANGKAADGLAFYHFERIPSAKLFKDMYRKALDDLPLSAAQIQRLVQEANVAFLLNMRLFEELDVAAHIPYATVRPLQEVLQVGPDHQSSTFRHRSAGGNASDQCPFLMEKKSPAPTAASMNPHSADLPSSKTRCPWPFVVFHDPKQFGRDWQTWALIGLILCLLWSQLFQN